MTRRSKSNKQWQNQIRLIAVSEISKAFKRAAIIQRVKDNIKKEGRVVTGGLVSPESSGSLEPARDDLFLTRKDKRKAISVRVYKVDNTTGLPSSIRVTTNVSRNHIDKKYWRLSTESPKGGFNVNEEGVDGITEWIKARATTIPFTTPSNGRGSDKPLNPNNPIEVQRLAFVISRSIRKRGIATRSSFDEPFYNRRTGVLATMRKSRVAVENRLVVLLGEQVADTISDNLFR